MRLLVGPTVGRHLRGSAREACFRKEGVTCSVRARLGVGRRRLYSVALF